MAPDKRVTNFAVDVVDCLSERPDTVALTWIKPGAIPLDVTFHDLKLRSDKVASVLADCGVQRGDSVLILLPLCIAWWEAVLGCMKVGALAVLGTDPSTPAELVAQVRLSGAQTLIAAMTMAEDIEAIADQTTIVCKIGVGWERDGWIDYDRRVSLATAKRVSVQTRADDRCLTVLSPENQHPPSTYSHGAQTFELDLLDAWRDGRTIQVREPMSEQMTSP